MTCRHDYGGTSALLIDDDRRTLGEFTTTLYHAGFSVRTARSVRDAMALLRQRLPDIIISELLMPDSSALDVLTLIRRNGLGLPFIVVTGSASIVTAVEAMRLGATTLVEKPVRGWSLMSLVEQALSPELSHLHLLRPGDAHSTARWIRAVLAAVQCSRDPRTLLAWSRSAGASRGTLKTWCQMINVRPKASLDLARLSRAIVQRRTYGLALENVLDITDSRTLTDLLKRGGVQSGLPSDMPPTISAFLAQQTFVRDAAVIARLEEALADYAQVA